MKAVILIRLKDEVPDSSGDVIAKSLGRMGYQEVEEVRVGKIIELELKAADRGNEVSRVEKMCQELLANSAVEEYEILSVE